MTIHRVIQKKGFQAIVLGICICCFISVNTPAQTSETITINSSTNSSYVARTSIKLIPGAKGTPGFKARINNDVYIEPVPSKNLDGQTSTGNSWNYIFTRTFRKEVTNAENFESEAFSANSDVIEQVQYFDGLGRIIQTIDIKGSPEKNDLVMPVAYDEFGREKFKYLPYSISGDGSFRANALISSGEQNVFYTQSGSLAGLDETDSRPFSELFFDNSPLNRVLSQQGPGNDWNTASKKTTFEYGTNAASTVILWVINTSDACVRNDYYDANSLYKNVVTDEDGNKTTEYKDKQGQVVLKETDLGAKTYYVYDDLGLLRCVIPPEAVNQIGSGALTDGIKNNYCYSYKYDSRKRMVEKKLPGVDVVCMVYDKRDRLAATQDGLQRSKASKEWSFNKYDALNRPILTGIIVYTGSRTDLQTIVDGYSGTSLYETRSTSATHHYYTESSFPNSSYSKTYYTVIYYDDYDYNNNNSPDKSFISDELTEPGNGTRKGLVTGTKSRVLDDAASASFVETAIFYDKYGRTIQTQQSQPVDASNTLNIRISNKINLLGEVLQTKTTNLAGSTVINTVLDEYTLDHRGRLLEAKKTVNNETPVAVKINYNQLGQLLSESLGVSGENYLQKTDYLYNIRGWLRGLNSTPETSDLFAMQLFYNDYLSNLDLTKGNYNGNISSMKWTNNPSSTWKAYGFQYDKLNRINSAIYGEYTTASSNINLGFKADETKNRFDEYGLTYDLNGNIKTLIRRGIDNPTLQTYAEIDNLFYTYNGNKLTKLDDSIPDIAGRGDFYEKVTNTTEYFYDSTGNMYKDDNKGIYNIVYNHLNLPKKVNFTASDDYIRYIYDASGAKLRKIVVKGNVTQYTENYAGACVYKTYGTGAFSAANDLQYMIAEKGRLVKNGGTFLYEYYLKDHLGNTRVVFADANNNGTIENNSAEVLQYADYYPFGMLHSRTTTLTDDNRRLYNGKEFQSETFNLDATAGDETLFDWYDYGARFYDPQIGRWHSVDPLAEGYYDYSPYCYVGNNPIKRIDPDGRYWDNEEEDKKTAAELSKSYNSNKNYYEKREQKFQARIDKGRNIEKNTERRDRAAEFKNEMIDAICELDAMGADQKVAFTFNKVEEGTIPMLEHGVASNGKDLLVTINHSGSIENKAHESKHGYQALTGETTPDNRSSTAWNVSDQNETEAYRRQYIMNSRTMPYFNSGDIYNPSVKQMGFDDITKGNVIRLFNVPSGVLPIDAARNRKNYPYF